MSMQRLGACRISDCESSRVVSAFAHINADDVPWVSKFRNRSARAFVTRWSTELVEVYAQAPHWVIHRRHVAECGQRNKRDPEPSRRRPCGRGARLRDTPTPSTPLMSNAVKRRLRMASSSRLREDGIVQHPRPDAVQTSGSALPSKCHLLVRILQPQCLFRGYGQCGEQYHRVHAPPRRGTPCRGFPRASSRRCTR